MIVAKVRLLLLVACSVSLLAPSRADSFAPAQVKCLNTIGKAGLAFARARMKLEQHCRGRVLAGGTCAAPDPAALVKLEGVLRAKLAKTCVLPSAGLAALGFPGPCPDANLGDGFTPDDLADCIRDSHTTIVGEMIALQSDAGLAAPLPKDQILCQREIAKQSASYTACTLKAVQKCRAKTLKEALPSVPPHLCATEDEKTVATITKCDTKLRDAVLARCSDGVVASLGVCTPNATTADAAASCLIDGHRTRIDGPAIDVPPDLIDYEYAVRGGLCGDGVVNNLGEECDGTDDAACPDQCGSALEPDGFFACLCTDRPRLRVVEHAAADTDNGWTGNSADQGVAEGGGYVSRLYDCDGFGNCNVGPSCSLPPHSPCGVALSKPSGTTGDAICAFFGQGMCRKDRTATGPHCFRDVQKKCDPNMPADPVCDAPGDYCMTTLAAPPNPLAVGGVTVCNVTIWSEDVVGTVNVATGESAVRAPQRSRTFGRTVGSADKPCPVCGGFCAISRERCEDDDGCATNQGPCITAPVCSDGPNAGKACRDGVPFGSTHPFFGTTSVDCPPEPAAQITSAAGLDLYIPLRTTGTVSMAPSVQCGEATFAGKACIDGASAGRPCATESECPGGTCAPQCFCPGQLRPNACQPACVGGTNDAIECAVDSECPGGFCHLADCRVDPGDDGSAQEGFCPAGPDDAWCSITTYQPCSSASDCAPPTCPYCRPDETCIAKKRACFVNSGIVRQGAPHTPEGVSVGIYCIAGDNAATNTVAGFPGPAAFTQPELQLTVP
ncbi:MAG: hypothetical protein IT293_10355 [Deltaproteobacteria bacterium]|nr:hypothetical protein [Deltaproteobacteria bacterium]